jgi:hypothetical protein
METSIPRLPSFPSRFTQTRDARALYGKLSTSGPSLVFDKYAFSFRENEGGAGFSVGILAEIKAKGMTVFARIDHAAGPVWRMDDDGRRISLIVTRSGRNAIGVEDDAGETQPPSVLGAVKSSGRGLAGNAQRPPSR